MKSKGSKTHQKSYLDCNEAKHPLNVNFVSVDIVSRFSIGLPQKSTIYLFDFFFYMINEVILRLIQS